jgi:hypothetical protein
MGRDAPAISTLRPSEFETKGGDYASRVYIPADVVTRASRIVAPMLVGEAEGPAR